MVANYKNGYNSVGGKRKATRKAKKATRKAKKATRKAKKTMKGGARSSYRGFTESDIMALLSSGQAAAVTGKTGYVAVRDWIDNYCKNNKCPPKTDFPFYEYDK